MDVMFLGVSKDYWEIINGFANWLAAVGTISAVVFSLRLAAKSSKRTAQLSVKLMLLAEIGVDHHPEHIMFSMVNTGDRVFHTDSIGWLFGKKEKQYFQQLFDRQMSSQMPLMQASGVAGKWIFNVQDGHWFSRMAHFLGDDWKKNIKTFKAIATTTTGEEFYAFPSQELLVKLRLACETRTATPVVHV
ncbi:hypothetical protein [Pseudomonas fluorescens]|uniref:hypothetical protein n=1 Tax=Pseudomonas fluorescens TaxID=294 RepID=UPI0012420556|nr:hypothetical protein [Pseudomonas fluorescens]